VKFLSSQISYFLTRGEARRNFQTLLKYILFLVALMAIFSVAFHVIMDQVEGQEHSWFTGFYWTLTVMSTLGFGDITFHSDIGRLFSSIVLLSGMILLLVLLPFMFIRFFFAPWIEARIRSQAPRELPPETAGHVILCRHDTITPGLIEKLEDNLIPYVIIEPDPQKAAAMTAEGLSVIAGEIDSVRTYEAARVRAARMVVANASDAENANITLTVRETAPEIPICVLVDREVSIDIMELSGATHVLPLKRLLGEQLAGRINAGRVEAHVIGHFHDLVIAEIPVHGTPLVGKNLIESRIRRATGASVLAVWEKGTLLSARPETVFTETSVLVVLGSESQIRELEALFAIYCWDENPVLVVGGGIIGRAAAAATKRRGVPIHLLEQDPAFEPMLAGLADRVFIGDAADRETIMRAGLAEAPSVVLTTNDDAVNIYLAVYCRRLHPGIRIVSRINHERNIASMRRAGADFVLSYASLGVTAILSYIRRSEMMVLGEDMNIVELSVPIALVGRRLGESGIGARTGLTVMAVSRGDVVTTRLLPDFEFQAGDGILLFGADEQIRDFKKVFSESNGRGAGGSTAS
jgi:Trk K+ transport system NAD-binding subunit